MDSRKKFISFLESVRTDTNTSLIESIRQGFAVCFESNFGDAFKEMRIYRKLQKKYGEDDLLYAMGLNSMKEMYTKLSSEWDKDPKNAKDMLRSYVKALKEVLDARSSDAEDEDEDLEDYKNYEPDYSSSGRGGYKKEGWAQKEFGLLGKAVTGGLKLPFKATRAGLKAAYT